MRSMASWTGLAGGSDWFATRDLTPGDITTQVSNWSSGPPAVFPAADDDINIGSEYTVTDAFGNQFNQDFTYQNVNIGGDVTGAATLNMTGNLINSGSLTASVSVQGVNVRWSGDGVYNLSSVAFAPTAATANVLFTNASTLTGSFNWSSSNLATVQFANEGVIDATTTAKSINFNNSAIAIVNDSVIESMGAGSGVNFFGNTINNIHGGADDGAISAAGNYDSGSAHYAAVTFFDGATVVGGNLTTNQTSLLQIAGAGMIFDGSTAAVNLTGNLAFINMGLSGVRGDSSALTMRGTVNVNAGSVIELNDANGSQLAIQGNGVTFAAGTQVTTLPADSRNLQIVGATGSDTLNNSGTIHGGLTLAGLTIANSASGVISADSSAGTMIGSASATTIVNQNILEDTTSGGLTIGANGSGQTTIDDSSGGTLLSTGAESIIHLYTATVRGGIVQTAAGGVISVENAGAVLDGTNASGLTIAGGSQINVNNNGYNNPSLHLTGAITNNAQPSPHFRRGRRFGRRGCFG